jgi:hypothetical protein
MDIPVRTSVKQLGFNGRLHIDSPGRRLPFSARLPIRHDVAIAAEQLIHDVLRVACAALSHRLRSPAPDADRNLERYERLAGAITDRAAVDAISAKIAELRAQKAPLHPQTK